MQGILHPLRRVLAIGSIVPLVLLSACGNLTGSVTQKTINIGMVSYPGDAPYFVAEKGGFFEKNGVKVHVQLLNDMPQAITALQSGSIDFFFSTADFTTVIANAGVDIKEIAVTDVGDGADGMLVTSDINTVTDLKGKTVQLAIGTPSHFLFRSVAAAAGLTKDDVKLVRMEADQAGAAFAAGQVNYAVTWEPWLSKAVKERANSKVLFTSHDKPGIIADTLVVKAEFLRDHAEQTKAVLKSLFEAVDALKNDPKTNNGYAAEGLGLTEAEFAEQVSAVRFLTLEENLKLFEKSTPKNLYQLTNDAAAIFKADGVIEKNVDADAIVDGSVLRSLAAAQ